MCPSLDILVPTLIRHGAEALHDHIALKPGKHHLAYMFMHHRSPPPTFWNVWHPYCLLGWASASVCQEVVCQRTAALALCRFTQRCMCAMLQACP